MNRINYIRFGMELAVTIFLLVIFPFNWERKLKLLCLYLFVMILSGRFRKKTLLFYDELKVICIGYLGFLFCACLTVALRSTTALLEIGLIIEFTGLDFLASIAINRLAHIWLMDHVRKPVVILGTGKTAQKLHHVTLANRFSTMDVVSFVDCNDSDFFEHVHQEKVPQQAPVIPYKDLDKLLQEQKIDTVLIAIPEISRDDLSKVTRKLASQVNNVKFLPYTQDQLNYASTVDDFDGLLMISTSHGKISWFGRSLKRGMDILGGLVGLLILGPAAVFVFVFNRANGDHGPVFFRQDRIGRDGKTFKVWKFRTMKLGAEEELKRMLKEDPALRKEYEENKKLQNDPRITKAGKVLRKYSLDEVPQFLNVIKGDMSLIGPRPYLLSEKEEMKDYYDSIIAFAPGMTGMWQTHGRSRVSFERRLELDDFYYHNWSYWLDFTILMKTFQIILAGDKGAV